MDRVIPENDESFPCLSVIDPYGDTTFNRLQLDPFLEEWTRLRERASNNDQKRMIDNVEALARKCKLEPHLYLKFVGD